MTRVVRAAPLGMIGRPMSFLTFSITNDPADIEKTWFSLNETILFKKKTTLKANLRKMRPGKESLAPGYCTRAVNC